MNDALKQLRMFLTLLVLTGILYPLLVTNLSQFIFNEKACGSLLTNPQGEPLGSLLIAQKFEKQEYFWGRPSATNYHTLPSGGSNLGPTSALLKKKVEERRAALLKAHPEADPATLPNELLFASGSGLDPHIRPATAYFQLERVASARGLQKDEEKQIFKDFVTSKIMKRRFGFIGEPRINVLLLNQAIDEKFGKSK